MVRQRGAGAPSQRGVRLGVDVGSVRVGVAVSDPDGILATPVTTLARDQAGDADITALADLVADRGAVEVVIGLPRTLRGEDGHAVRAARDYGERLAARIAPVPVIYADERLTSVHAQRVLFDAGVPGRSRRAVVDQVAAVDILQARLDHLRMRTRAAQRSEDMP